jgi:hypothetical protein
MPVRGGGVACSTGVRMCACYHTCDCTPACVGDLLLHFDQEHPT